MASGLPRGLPPVGAGGSGLPDNRSVAGQTIVMTTLPLVRPPSTWARAWGASSNGYARSMMGRRMFGLDELGDLVELGTAGAHEQERVPHALAARRSAGLQAQRGHDQPQGEGEPFL